MICQKSVVIWWIFILTMQYIETPSPDTDPDSPEHKQQLKMRLEQNHQKHWWGTLMLNSIIKKWDSSLNFMTTFIYLLKCKQNTGNKIPFHNIRKVFHVNFSGLFSWAELANTCIVAHLQMFHWKGLVQ